MTAAPRGGGVAEGVRTTIVHGQKGQVKQNWFITDATDQVLGRLASEIATVLMGKHRPDYTPHVDTGDYVVVVNAEKIVMTGRKLEVRHYTWYTAIQDCDWKAMAIAWRDVRKT